MALPQFPPQAISAGCPEAVRPTRAGIERVAETLHDIGVLTKIDRAALAASCQAYGRWVEAEENMKKTPVMLKTPSGYVQQSPWMSVANKQLELMGRYMTELGMTPSARTRVASQLTDQMDDPLEIRITYVSPDGTVRDGDGNVVDEETSPPITVSDSV